MTLWEHFESLVLEFMEARVAEILTQGDVAPDPKLVARIREDAAWAAERAIARFQASNGAQNTGGKHGNH
jgi:hypothetical protein